MDRLLNLFCDVDDFCNRFLPEWQKQQIASGEKQRHRQARMYLSEMLTIMIYFHQSSYRHFKAYYHEQVIAHWQAEFPRLLSYTRFVHYIPSLLVPLMMYMESRKAAVTGLSFVDSTPLAVCHNKRISRHCLFQGIAGRGKTSMGWFYGLKLHLIVNEEGGLLSYALTPGNTDDRTPLMILAKHLQGKLFGDRGYISKKHFLSLLAKNVLLITTLRRNMKNTFMPILDKILLRKRFIIETINDQLKNISQIEHTRHRSVINCFVNIIAGLVAYTHQPKKPSLNVSKHGLLKGLIATA